MGKGAVVSSKKPETVQPEGKKEKRKTRQAKAGLSFGVNKAHKLITSKRRGKVSTDASVTLAVFLEHIERCLLKDAAAAADVGIAPVKEGEKQPHRKVTSAHLQIALTKNPWLSQYIAKGRVVGSAPATSVPIEGGGEEEEEQSSESGSSSSGSESSSE